MSWEIEGTDEFQEWFQSLGKTQAEDVASIVDVLEEKGPALGWPYSSDVRSSRHGHMRELRIQSSGRSLRVLYAFDPRRTAILLLGGDKSGDGRWYERAVPRADDLYDEYLRELRAEGILDDAT